MNKIQRAIKLGWKLVNSKSDSIHLFEKGGNYILIRNNKARWCIKDSAYKTLVRSYMERY
jgi:hypothetical protein